jgi:hypothetical protein
MAADAAFFICRPTKKMPAQISALASWITSIRRRRGLSAVMAGLSGHPRLQLELTP